MDDQDLFERLGGESGVQAAVVLFYDKVMVDADLAPFFAGYDLKDQVVRHIAFMTKAFGGEAAVTENLAPAHQKLVHRGMGDRHIDRFIVHMRKVLEELDVDARDIEIVAARLEAARGKVLGRT